MIGGGGSIALRAAAEVMGTCCGAGAGVGAGAGAAIGFTGGGGALGRIGGGAAYDELELWLAFALGLGLGLGLTLGAGAGAAAKLGRCSRCGGAAGRIVSGEGSPPRKSFTRVSTSWLIETLLASQNAFRRSYVERLTLMLRRVCFLAIFPLYATGSVSASRSY